MSKFGELIDADIPILLDFYTEWNEPSTAMHPVLKDVAAAIGDKGKVIKIDVDKNQELAEALRIKGLPTLMIYRGGEMVWRQSGEQDANTLIGLMQEYVG
ncbi:thioredoxin family protein [Sungkyunkwania multivorans]|uniref:Thioredoxin family protein n=1 Tax=Sungkyunkwania multivorans TaxID=1173618 RepID=A0ABW3CV90_9FLAO